MKIAWERLWITPERPQVRVETIPLLVGILIALVGLGLLADAWLPEDVPRFRERRRTERTERHLGGEASIGLGVLCVAAAVLGRDSWSYGTVAVIAGTLLLVIGTWLNRRFLADRIVNRGALRRADTGGSVAGRREPQNPGPPPPRKNRIR